MEQGKRVPAAEKNIIQKYRDTIFVSYQSSGYKDERTEVRILRNTFKPETVRRSNNQDTEFLLVQDQLATHKCKSALTYVAYLYISPVSLFLSHCISLSFSLYLSLSHTQTYAHTKTYTHSLTHTQTPNRILKSECNTFSVFLPADHTPFIQLVDDNVGKSFRRLIYDRYDTWVTTEFKPNEKLSKSCVRQLLIEWTALSALQWNKEVLAVKLGTD